MLLEYDKPRNETISTKKYPEFDDRLEYAEMRRMTVEEK